MINKEIGNKLKQKREALNLSPKQVSSELGITARAYLYMEGGSVDFKVSSLVNLKSILGFNISDLFDESNSQIYNVHNHSEQVENMGVIHNTNKELLQKVAELYERIIVLEKKM